jgi:hypothetical protein
MVSASKINYREKLRFPIPDAMQHFRNHRQDAAFHFRARIQKPKIQTKSPFIFRLAHKMYVGIISRLAPLDYFEIQE